MVFGVVFLDYLNLIEIFILFQKLDFSRDGSLLVEGENPKDSLSSALAVPSDHSDEFKYRGSSNKWNDELSPAGSTVTESTQVGKLIIGSSCGL